MMKDPYVFDFMNRLLKISIILFLCIAVVTGVSLAESPNVFSLTKELDRIKTKHDSGFSEEESIEDNDLHYNWGLGEFYIQGYSDKTLDENKVPVFLMRNGDQIQLSFSLKQDLNALNGNTNYKISEDTNGRDITYEIPQQNFGKGCLIIQKTDASGQSVITVSPDYLSSVAANAEESKKALNEGSYRGVLDYEIQYPVTLNTWYNDYKIPFQFRIVNSTDFAAIVGGTQTHIVTADVQKWVLIGTVSVAAILLGSLVFGLLRHSAKKRSSAGEIQSPYNSSEPSKLNNEMIARPDRIISTAESGNASSNISIWAKTGNVLRQNKKRIWICLLVIGVVLSLTVLQPWLSNPNTYPETFKFLNEKMFNANLMVAGTTSTSIIITLFPDDVGTPIAGEIAKVAGYMVIVLSAIVLERILLTFIGYIAATFVFPLACFLGIVYFFLNNSELKTKLLSNTIRLFIFGICIVLIIPVGCKFGNLIEQLNKEHLSLSIQDSEKAKSIIENGIPPKESNPSIIQKAITAIWNGIQEMSNWVKNTVTNFITTVAILLVTTVVIPILILIAFLIMIKYLTKKDYINVFVQFSKQYSNRFSDKLPKAVQGMHNNGKQETNSEEESTK